MKELVTELLKLRAAAETACDVARKAGDQELFYALRDIRWKAIDCLDRIAPQHASTPAEAS